MCLISILQYAVCYIFDFKHNFIEAENKRQNAVDLSEISHVKIRYDMLGYDKQ